MARSAATAFRNIQLYESLNRQLEQRKKDAEHLRLMVNELNHRVKNTLATVQSVASQTFRAAGSVAEAKTGFDERLQALSLIHEMLTDASWGERGPRRDRPAHPERPRRAPSASP
ncbi:MAG: HWE histidine kinase domain-containing protein [Caulobacteraceae bacterium]